jgi:hypothetical protein
MDLARSWAVGIATAVVVLLLLGAASERGLPALMLLVPALSALTASLTHPSPHRDRLGRHVLAAAPPAAVLPVLGAVSVREHVVAAGNAGGLLLQLAAAAVIATAVPVLVRALRSRSRRLPALLP